ncbi:MAG: hypothetical protein K0U64_01680 [Actinomycetia bacterium]|nr:hypothetical protein [Actinomycetes bacterium]
MGKTFIAGLLLALAAIVTIIVSSVMGLDIDSVFFGLTVGAVLALVNDKSGVLGRIGGFLVGVVVTMAGYIIRILALNESLVGQILFAVIVALLIAGICAVTSGRLPIWSGFLGAGLVAGSYEASFLAAPQDITTDLFTNVSQALVPMAIAFLAGIFVKPEIVGVETSEDAEIDKLESEIAHDAPKKSEV